MKYIGDIIRETLRFQPEDKHEEAQRIRCLELSGDQRNADRLRAYYRKRDNRPESVIEFDPADIVERDRERISHRVLTRGKQSA